MSTKYQIFVSSTYEDLKVERDRVIQGILEMGHIPVGMEMFSAADEAQWQIIARHIDESDYYVVIVAHRYGSMDGDVSYTRKEYEYALAKGIPIIGFVIDSEAPWPGHRTETDAGMLQRLIDFKTLVQAKPVGYWSNADDLYGKASVAIVKAITANPRVGWVRASSALGPEITAEISRLSSENAQLRNQIRQLEEENRREASAELSELWAQLSKHEWSYHAKFPGKVGWQEAVSLSYAYLFSIMAPSFVIEATTKRVSDLIRAHSRMVDEEERDTLEVSRATLVPTNAVSELLAEFMSLGLMQPSTKRHAVADKGEYWSLTELGQQLLTARTRASFAATTATADDGGSAS